MMHFKKFGKYTIIKKLASGGMADILLASDLNPTGFGRFVVIKRILSDFSENEEFTDMFKNEGKVACNLKHKNITPIYEFGVEKNQFFLSMEYVSGRNLREVMKKLQFYKSAISIPNIVYITKEVASGLNYAHNAIDANTGQPLNVIHRDVSPQNIMLSFDGEIKLIDFGIAKIADTNLTRAGHLKGKFSYMSPEQANGDLVDERTDVFCLGIILWEMLANKRLFASKNELNSLKKIKNCDIPNVREINSQIPVQLAEIVKKCLHKNKNLRYETASKLEQDLNIFLNKNYPEYSQYDFISLMKTTYRKEIMEERSKLKNYSSEFKKYIGTLNIEESIKSNVDLNIPDLSTFLSVEDKKNGKTTLTGHFPRGTKSKTGHTYTKTSPLHPVKNTKTLDKSSTLIQKKELDTQTNTTKIKSASLREDSISVTNETNPANLYLKSEDMDFHKNKSSVDKSLSLYDHTALMDDVNDSKKSKIPTVILTASILLVASGVFVKFWSGEKKTETVSFIDFLLNRNPTTKAPAVTIQPIKDSTPLVRPNFKNTAEANKKADVITKKILINSKPSGASIFINGEFSSQYTPAAVNLRTDRSSSITLKKRGFLPKKVTFDPKKQMKAMSLTLKVDTERGLSSKKIQIID